MKLSLLALILVSVTSSAVAQIMLKTGMSDTSVVNALDGGGAWQIAQSIIRNVWIISGFALYFLGAIIWLFVLARVDASFAYPFVGLGFIITLALGRILLGDAVGLARVIGTLLVAAGVIVIATG